MKRDTELDRCHICVIHSRQICMVTYPWIRAYISFEHVKQAEILISICLKEEVSCFVGEIFDIYYISNRNWYIVSLTGSNVSDLPKLNCGFGGCRLAICLLLCECISYLELNFPYRMQPYMYGTVTQALQNRYEILCMIHNTIMNNIEAIMKCYILLLYYGNAQYVRRIEM